MSNSASTSRRARPRIAITAGEPAGIGPELVAALDPAAFEADLVVIGDARMLRARGSGHGRGGAPVARAALEVLHIPAPAPVLPGRLDTRNADYVLATLARAADGCLDGEFDAVVTGPVQKSVINDAGRPFTGHTEFFAERAGGVTPVMMLVAGDLRVALVTTHLPLAEVPRAITTDAVRYVIETVAGALQGWFGVRHPAIAVCGLNPHAGEGGHLGREDLDIIAPAMAAARCPGCDVRGPLPADTAFTPAQRSRFDAFVSMYHDQGLPVLKALGFGHAVNVTLGLPFIRTSVDHGTALDLAGTSRADPGSLVAAIELAIRLYGTP